MKGEFVKKERQGPLHDEGVRGRSISLLFLVYVGLARTICISRVVQFVFLGTGVQ
jgi:hypothetical protein